MTRLAPSATPVFAQPIRQVVMMLSVIGGVAAGAWVLLPVLRGVFAANPLLNGFIAAVFLFGVVTCFWQVWQLVQSVSWIDAFVQDRPGAETDAAPRILAPLAALLGPRTARMQISNSSGRSILDSVATRIDEARDITRYLANLLIFLGLLGTFYGLATTVPAIVETIRSLAPQEGESSLDIFSKLMGGLESQLGGMGTAFSSSLLGLAGSLVIGLLELFASHGQNRFYRELEEWLSGFTRLGIAGDDGEKLDQASIMGFLDQIAGQMTDLQAFYAERDEIREQESIDADERVLLMARNVERLGQFMLDDSEANVTRLGEMSRAMTRLAEGQEKLVRATEARPDNMIEVTRALTRMAEAQERLIQGLEARPADEESRQHLRAINDNVGRLADETHAARQLSTADLKRELVELTEALRALGRS